MPGRQVASPVEVEGGKGGKGERWKVALAVENSLCRTDYADMAR